MSHSTDYTSPESLEDVHTNDLTPRTKLKPSHKPPFHEPNPKQGKKRSISLVDDKECREMAVRASQACVNCRSKKAKCNEKQPCDNCIKSELECVFAKGPPAKKRDPVRLLLPTINKLRHDFQSFESSLGDIRSLVNSMLDKLDRKYDSRSIENTIGKQGCANQSFDIPSSRSGFPIEGFVQPTYPSYTGMQAVFTNESLGWPCTSSTFNSFPYKYHAHESEQFHASQNFSSFINIQNSNNSQYANGQSATDLPSNSIDMKTRLTPKSSKQRHGEQSINIPREYMLRLLDSYTKTTHNVYPILRIGDFHDLVEKFIAMYGTVTSPTSSASSALGNRFQQKDHSLGKSVIDRTVNNAFCLLILALGAAYQSRDSFSAATERILTQPFDESVQLEYDYDALGQQAKARNVSDTEDIPGMGYFTLAVGILGETYGDCSLRTVQAQLHAGLYMRELSVVNKCSAWTTSACITMQMLLKQYNGDLTDIPQVERAVFWACVALEREMTEKFGFIQSGISSYESYIPFPGQPDGLGEGTTGRSDKGLT